MLIIVQQLDQACCVSLFNRFLRKKLKFFQTSSNKVCVSVLLLYLSALLTCWKVA